MTERQLGVLMPRAFTLSGNWPPPEVRDVTVLVVMMMLLLMRGY